MGICFPGRHVMCAVLDAQLVVARPGSARAAKMDIILQLPHAFRARRLIVQYALEARVELV